MLATRPVFEFGDRMSHEELMTSGANEVLYPHFKRDTVIYHGVNCESSKTLQNVIVGNLVASVKPRDYGDEDIFLRKFTMVVDKDSEQYCGIEKVEIHACIEYNGERYSIIAPITDRPGGSLVVTGKDVTLRWIGRPAKEGSVRSPGIGGVTPRCG